MASSNFYRSRNGGFRRWNSYSVGYSGALSKGLVPDNGTNRKKFGSKMDLAEPVEWHHGLRGEHVNFYNPLDLK